VRKLVCNFEAPDDDVFTLYDNWEKAVARFPHVSIIKGFLYGGMGCSLEAAAVPGWRLGQQHVCGDSSSRCWLCVT
jgi:hypothetical protein